MENNKIIFEIFDHLCRTLQVNAYLCFTHMLTITFPAWGLQGRDHKKTVPI